MKRRQADGCVAFVCASIVFGGLAQAGTETTAFACATVTPGGPRLGDNGKKYLNVQGKKSGSEGQYASFGVVDFHAPAAGLQSGKVKGVTLTLVQSIPSSAHDGRVKFYLSNDTKSELGATAPNSKPALKFDKETADGLGEQLKTRFLLGSGAFTKDATGHVDTFKLTLSDAAEAYLREQLKRGGDIRLIVAPDGEDVAATYFGVGAPMESNRPKLTVDDASNP